LGADKGLEGLLKNNVVGELGKFGFALLSSVTS